MQIPQPQQHMRILPITFMSDVQPGDDLAAMLAEGARKSEVRLRNHDCLVIDRYLVSKAEDRVVIADTVNLVNTDDTVNIANTTGTANTLSYRNLAESESVRVLRRHESMIISETRQGFICANAGIARCSTNPRNVVTLPVDSDRSARRIRDSMKGRFNVELGVIVTAKLSRAWRKGVTSVAIGCAGIAARLVASSALKTYRADTEQGADTDSTDTTQDAYTDWNTLALADEIASVAGLMMTTAQPSSTMISTTTDARHTTAHHLTPAHHTNHIYAVIIRGLNLEWFREASVKSEIVPTSEEHLFR